MDLAKWMIAGAAVLCMADPAAARHQAEWQARFLTEAAVEEAEENDHTGERDFLALAELAGSRVVTRADAPPKWRDGLKVRSAKRSALHDRLLALDGKLDGLDRWTVAANEQAVAGIFVNLLHARHELSEPGLHVLDAERYLDEAEDALGMLRPFVRDGDRDRDREVDRDGDRDGDGIPDSIDRCPDEPETFNGFLDEDGCPDTAPERVYFRSDSSQLDAAAVEALAQVAWVIGEHPSVDFRIDGHCDSQNTDDYNMRLGRRRAIAVRDHLVNVHGIDARRFGIATFGESTPAADNSTVAGRALNRRVELTALP